MWLFYQPFLSFPSSGGSSHHPAHAMCTRSPLEVRGGSGGRLQDPGSGQVAHPLAPCRPPPRLCTASQSSGAGSGAGAGLERG